MNVLEISNDYFYPSGLYRKLHKELESLDQNVVFFVPCEKKSKHPNKLSNVVLAPCFHRVDRIFYFYKQRKIYRKFKQQIIKNRPDVIHAHFVFSAGYCALKAKREFGIPYVTAVRNADLNVFFRFCFWLRPLGISILMNASYIIFLSDSYKNAVIEKYIPQYMQTDIAAKCVVIPNGIDESWFCDYAPRKKSDKESIRIVYAGCIDKNKNLTATINSCKLLIQQGYKVKYTVAGSISNNRVYKHIIKNDFVEFLGTKKAYELRTIYSDQDVFVMPSFTETFGLVYAEAISQGLPIIYTKGQGFDCQFPEGTVGYHVEAHNPNDIVNKIQLILANYEEISKNCCQFCKKFDWKIISAEYVKLYKEIINGEA